MKYEIPVYCTEGIKKLLFHVYIDEDNGIIKVFYKEKGKSTGEVSLDEILIQILKSKVSIIYKEKN